MELTHDEVESLILKIASGKEFVYVDSKDVLVAFTQPTNELQQQAEAVYTKSYKEAVKDGLLPIKDLEKLIKDRGLFTDKDQTDINKLRSQLDAQKIVLSKTVKVRANRDRINKMISDLNEQIEAILHKRYSALSLSAESKSEERKSQFLCWACSAEVSGNLLWNNFDTYSSETDLIFKSEVLSKFIVFLSGIDVTTIRFIARSTLWRIRYTTSMKVSDPLFGRASSDYTNDQLSLAYWSNFYDQVYSMMPEDKPTDEVIEDDRSLDVYMESYYKELNNEAAVRRGNASRTTGSMTAFDKEEVIVTKASELYQEIEYDQPREAQKLKDRTEIRKKAGSKRR